MKIDFGQFIDAFGNGYRTMPDIHDGLTAENAVHKTMVKETFCRALLCEITSSEDIVIYINGIRDAKSKRSLSAFQSYYKNGNKRRSLRAIAVGIINTQSMDKNKFKSFLENYVQHYSKAMLCCNYQKYLTDVTEETLFNSITDAFEQILVVAYNEPDNRQKSPEPMRFSESGNEPDTLQNNDSIIEPQSDEIIEILQDATTKPDERRTPPMPNSKAATNDSVVAELINQINCMLKGLIKTGRKIANNQRAFGSIKYPSNPTPELWDQLQRQLNELKLRNSLLLKQDSGKHPNVEDLFDAIIDLKADHFVLSDFEYCILIPGKEQPVHNVKNLLAKLESEFPTQPDTEQETPAP